MSESRNHCRHIRPSGHRCASPALRHEHFCYYHHTSRGTVLKREAQQRQGRLSTFELLDFDDRTAIQLNLAEIARRIAAHEIDPRRAGLLLYALQIASCNLPKPAISREPAQLLETIDELIHDETHGDLAPEQAYQSAPREKNLEEILHEQWLKDAEDAAARLAEEAAERLRATKHQGVPHDHRSEAEVVVGGSGYNPIQGLTIDAVTSRYPEHLRSSVTDQRKKRASALGVEDRGHTGKSGNRSTSYPVPVIQSRERHRAFEACVYG